MNTVFVRVLQVLLKTTLGDLDVELWSKETPLACRNFVQLCLEGYYDGSIFHRVIRGGKLKGRGHVTPPSDTVIIIIIILYAFYAASVEGCETIFTGLHNN